LTNNRFLKYLCIIFYRKTNKHICFRRSYMALTKTEITEKIQKVLDISRTTSYDIMEDFLEIIKETLERGEDVMISGFGKFCVNEKKARKGRNPATSEEMILPSRRVVTFKCSGKLRNMINND